MVQSRFRQAPATLPPAIAILATPSVATTAEARPAVVAQPAPTQLAGAAAPPKDFSDLRLPTRCLHEAVGTAFIVTGASAGAAALSSPIATAAISGCCVATAVATFSSTSGAHFNPSVTLALIVDGQFGWREAPAYLLAQLLGACAASTAVAKLALGAQVALPAAAPAAFIEGGLTALLVGYCFSVGDLSKREVIRPAFVPVLVGCLIFSINSIFGSFAAAYNPAMATGARLVAMVLGGWGARALAGSASFVLGSLVGGVLGCKIYQTLVGSREYDKVCSWICAEGPKARAA
jgi:glycerol uptake facilitator-like aquaporin